MLTVLGIMQRHDEAMAAFACLGRKGGARRMRRGSNYPLEKVASGIAPPRGPEGGAADRLMPLA